MVFSNEASDAYQHLIKLGSKKLSEFLGQHGPITIPKRYGEDPLMGLCRIVVGQQLSGHAAQAIWAGITAAFPDRNARLVAFQNQNSDLTGLSNAKRNTLQVIALHGDSWIDQTLNLDANARRAALIAVKGIGPWTIAMWELFVLAEPDCWSDGDLILKRISARLAEEQAIDRRDWVALASPFRSYLALFCWAIHDQGMLADVPIR